MQTNIEESKVIELLKSSNPEDQELGVIIAYREFGVEWCKETFGYYSGGHGESIYCKAGYNTSGGYYFQTESRIESKLILFDELDFFLGGSTIASIHEMYKTHQRDIKILDMRENK